MTYEYLHDKVEKLLKLNKSELVVTHWTQNTILNRLNDREFDTDTPTKYSELLAYLYQGAGLKLDGKQDFKKLYSKSYDIWKVIWYSMRSTNINEHIRHLFHVVVTGLLSDSLAEVRMILMEIELEECYEKVSKEYWPDYLENSIYIILLILIRKGNGWEDIKLVENIIDDIQKTQNLKEESYFDGLEKEKIYPSICWIAALFNILEAIEKYKKYMIEGKPENIEKVIKRYCRDSYDLLEQTNRDKAKYLFALIERALIKLVSMSIWSTISGTSEKIDEYVDILTMTKNDKPIFELWPSQQQAIQKNLFDNTKTAIVVQMPTSAGKTLLSKFYILQTLNLFSDAKIAYIVPTRALVNQVKRDLRGDFNKLDIKVKESIPYSDIEEMEDELLLKKADIIVTTPEKLDILMRAKHPIIEKLKLVVVDEAHSLQDENRGAKLELLLAMLRKEDRNLRILMLSPFIQNASNIASWLGDNRGHDIYVDWKPSQQFTGTYMLRQIKRGKHKGEVNYIPSSLNTMYNSEFKVSIHESTRKNLSKADKAVKLAEKYRKIGGVLILCIRKNIAENVAKQFKENGKELEKDKLIKLEELLDLVEEEMGKDTLLYECIKKGCAYHHSSLPLIIREEIENAISRQLIDIVASTTTLAQGMNFPISTVIFQGMTMPSSKFSRDMKPSEFWNIAGRAGRALVDKEGHIIAVCNNENEINKFKGYLRDKNQEVLSSLIEMLKSIPEDGLSRYHIREYKELSALLQYIYHLILLDPKIEIDDLLRGSLVYHQLEGDGNENLAEKLLVITRNYIAKLDKDKKRRNLMEVIDKTGLSSISMYFLLNKLREFKIDLKTNEIFNNDDGKLEEIINLVNQVPEINLGMYSDKGFSPELVAKITKDWVNGSTIREIADSNIDFNEKVKTVDDKMSLCGEYIYGKLINNLPWGISAIQKANGVLSKKDNDKDDILIPSYIYFGVKTKEAVALCMLGVPRFAAEMLARYWRKKSGYVDFNNLEDLESWLNSIDEDQWLKCFPDKYRKKGKVSYRMWKRRK